MFVFGEVFCMLPADPVPVVSRNGMRFFACCCFGCWTLLAATPRWRLVLRFAILWPDDFLAKRCDELFLARRCVAAFRAILCLAR
jgi:hypothetical protein